MIFTLRWLPVLAGLALAACGDVRDPCTRICGAHTACVDDVATRVVDSVQSCPADASEGCPTETYRCDLGCRPGSPELAPGDPLSALCVESQRRKIGDPCGDDDGCRPQVAEIPADGPVTTVYLRCDTDAGRCVERPPTDIPDFRQSCGIAPTDPHHGVVETAACSRGVCVTGQTIGQGCVEQACTARCTDDGDCPPGSLCATLWARDRVCMRGRSRHLWDPLPCPSPVSGGS